MKAPVKVLVVDVGGTGVGTLTADKMVAGDANAFLGGFRLWEGARR